MTIEGQVPPFLIALIFMIEFSAHFSRIGLIRRAHSLYSISMAYAGDWNAVGAPNRDDDRETCMHSQLLVVSLH